MTSTTAFIKRTLSITLIIIIAALHGHIACAQDIIYGLNKSNGLPTNHVYCALVDHNGYLWLGTENGVVKYNGYQLKRFTYEDGLPNIDVWNLSETPDNKIFIHSQSKEMGYIKNNKYTAYKLVNNDKELIVSPKFFEIHNNKAYFYNSTANFDTSIIRNLCGILVGDSIIFSHYKGSSHTIKLVIPHLGLITLKNNKLYYQENDSYKLLCERKTLASNPLAAQQAEPLGENYILYKFGDSVINYLKYYTCETGKIELKKYDSVNGYKIKYLYATPKKLVVITSSKVYTFDKDLKCTQILSTDKYYKHNGIKASNITNVINSTIWGNGVTTNNSGVIFDFSANSSALQPSKHDLSESVYLGKNSPHSSLWWNEKNNKLILLSDKNEITQSPSLKIGNVYKFKKWYGDTVLLYTKENIQMLSLSTFNNAPLTKYFQKIDPVSKDAQTIWNDQNFTKSILLKTIKDLVLIRPGLFYVVTGQLIGLKKYSYTSKEMVTIDYVTSEKYAHLLYDTTNNRMLAYNGNKILIYDTQSEKYETIGYDQVKQLGINKISNIFLLPDGNFLIQDFNKILICDLNELESKRVLNNYDLEGAEVDVSNNTLTVGGAFGIVQYTITHEGLLEKTNLFLNPKNTLYNELTNMCVFERLILLNTDKGTYEIDLNTINAKQTNVINTQLEKRILITYANNTRTIYNDDTVTLPKNIKTISFDAINAFGIGELKFKYAINNGSWKDVNGQNITLSQLQPNKYHTLKVQAYDKAWKSKTINIILYITPYWWQTTGGKTIIITLTLTTISLLVFIVIVITRKRISKRDERKNQQRDLELKSIYSQINPHFIFNTLGTAQYFIRKNKTKEAYAHISQFSDLLRAYLKSSRNKYISIAEEVENLENYLQLQLSRFELKFNYHITVDDKLDPEHTTIPSLLLQPIVENALNHGIFHMKGVGELNIKFLKGDTAQQLICIVDDNGIGRNKAKQLRGKITQKVDSYGTILIKELVDTFNKYEPVSINLQYIDKQVPETGTMVRITIDNTSPNLSNDQSYNS